MSLDGPRSVSGPKRAASTDEGTRANGTSWDRKTGEVLKKDYFRSKPGGGSWEFIQDFWKRT
jgi:hypothetical protein